MNNNYNIKKIDKKKIGKSITKTTVNIKPKNKKYMSLSDISNIVDELNKNNSSNSKYSHRSVVVASTPIQKNFNIKGYSDTNIRYNSMADYLNGRVKETTKFTNITEISITILKELIE
jgi:HD superfamily phosphohydrolase